MCLRLCVQEKKEFELAAYWLARCRIDDPVQYKKYTDLVPAIIAKFGGKVLARGGRYKIVEGPENFQRFVVIEERSGGGGMLSAETVARASADGYTLLLATGTHTISPNFFKLSYDMTRDFAPVTLLGTIPFALAVQPSLPVKSVDDLIRIAR